MAQWDSDLLGLMEDEDEDTELQKVLALSMRTYQAEHPGQGEGQGEQLPSECPTHCMCSLQACTAPSSREAAHGEEFNFSFANHALHNHPACALLTARCT
jgi:hypothetical protein